MVPSGLVYFRLCDTVWTIGLQTLTDLNQGLYSETLFYIHTLVQKSMLPICHSCKELTLSLKINNVHHSNSKCIIVVLLAVNDAYSADRSLFIVLSLRSFVPLLSLCEHSLLLCTNCRNIWQVSASHQTINGSMTPCEYSLKLLFLKLPQPLILSKHYLFSEKRQNADLLGNLTLMPLCWRHRDGGRGDLNFLLPGHVTAHPACLLWWRSHDNKLWKLNEWLPWKRSFLL